MTAGQNILQDFFGGNALFSNPIRHCSNREKSTIQRYAAWSVSEKKWGGDSFAITRPRPACHLSAHASHGTAAGGGTRLRRTSAFASHTAEAVLAQRGQGQVLEYQVKWLGFSDPRGTTWELASQLHGVAGFDEALVSFQASA